MQVPELNISWKEAQTRLRDSKCLNCGQPQTNKELNSCSKKVCVKVLRPIYHWARKVSRLDYKVYIGG